MTGEQRSPNIDQIVVKSVLAERVRIAGMKLEAGMQVARIQAEYSLLCLLAA